MVFDEDDWEAGQQRENERDFSEETGVSLERSQGDVEVSGVDTMLERAGISKQDDREQDTPKKNADQPTDIVKEPDYDQIRQKADYMLFINAHDHLPTDSGYKIETPVRDNPQELAEDIVSFLQEGGDQNLFDYLHNDSSADTEELEKLHLVESGQLSKLGQYVADQVFEYSED